MIESAVRVPAATPPGLLSQVWRRKWTWLFVFAALTGAAASVLEVLPEQYTAVGQIIITEPDPMSNNAASAWLQKVGDPEDLESNLLLIRSPQLLRQVADNAAGLIRRECEAAQRSPAAKVKALLTLPARDCNQIAGSEKDRLEWVTARFGTGTVGRSRVIAVSYASQLPDVAQQMTNALISAFLDSEKAKRLESRMSALAWLHQEATQVGDALRREETEIEAFRRAHGLVRGQTAPITSERLSATTGELAQAETAQAEAMARLQEVGRGGAADSRAVLEARTIEDLKQQLAVVTAQLANQAVRLGPNHPALAGLKEQHDALQARIASETARIADSAHRAASAANARVASLSSQLNTIKQEAGAAADSETQIASLLRDIEVKRTIYVDLSQRASQLETERRVITTSVQLVNLAELPSKPSFPKRVPFLAGGVTLAGLLATGAALMRGKSADRSIHAPGALQALTGLSVLARIPADRWGRSPLLAGDRDLPLSLVLERLQTPSLLQESVRGLYARLTLMGYGTRNRTLLFTSAEGREGKTFTALALAQFAAASGQRVLLVECDMRRPSIQAALGLPTAAGLTEYLSGKVDEVPLVHPARHPGLGVVLAGEASMASTELLTSPRFNELLKLAKHFDLVILDSPPSGQLMDACVIAPKVDGVIYCARWGRTVPEQVAAGLQDLHDAHGTVAGLVITFAPQGGRVPYGARLAGPNTLALEAAGHA